MKHTAPGSLFIIFAFAILFSLDFIFRSTKPKIQKYLAALHLLCDLFTLSITTLSHILANLRHHYPKGIDNPFNTSDCEYLLFVSAAIYVVLLGSPTCSITLVSSLRKIPTVAVLHHPFLFGEILT